MGQNEILMVTSRKISHFHFITITARACVILKCLSEKQTTFFPSLNPICSIYEGHIEYSEHLLTLYAKVK